MSTSGHGQHLRGRQNVGNEKKPIPVILHCPQCRKQHIDEGEWATRPHRTHQCVDDANDLDAGCGHKWRAASVPTVGVKKVL